MADEPARPRSLPQSPENLAAQRAEQFRTMPLVGIGARYVDRRFRDYLYGGEAKELFLSTWPRTTSEGVGITISGHEVVLGDLQIMMARAAHLAGMVVRVMSLVELARAVRRGDEVPEGEVNRNDLLETEALFVPRFHDVGACPVHPYAVAEIVDVVERRWADNRAFFPWSLCDPSALWWPQHFLNQMADRNEWFEVGA